MLLLTFKNAVDLGFLYMLEFKFACWFKDLHNHVEVTVNVWAGRSSCQEPEHPNLVFLQNTG